MALFSFIAGTIGLRLDFVVTALGDPPAEATSATVTWIAQDGRRRPLALTDDVRAIFSYTLSAGDYPAPRWETGILQVSIATACFWQGPFTVAVTPLPV